MNIFKFIIMFILFFIGMIIIDAGEFEPIVISHTWRMVMFVYPLCLAFFLSWLYDKE